MTLARFDWDPEKDAENVRKHGVSFARAQYAFADPRRVIARDVGHSLDEERFYCSAKPGVPTPTARFTYRSETIRIIGAGAWRKGKTIYERENHLHR